MDTHAYAHARFSFHSGLNTGGSHPRTSALAIGSAWKHVAYWLTPYLLQFLPGHRCPQQCTLPQALAWSLLPSRAPSFKSVQPDHCPAS